MVNQKRGFTSDQTKQLKASAENLHAALRSSKNPIAIEILNGKLGGIIKEILRDKIVPPLDDIPHFEQMTRDYFPEIEEEYFEFYSFAKYGEPAGR